MANGITFVTHLSDPINRNFYSNNVLCLPGKKMFLKSKKKKKKLTQFERTNHPKKKFIPKKVKEFIILVRTNQIFQTKRISYIMLCFIIFFLYLSSLYFLFSEIFLYHSRLYCHFLLFSSSGRSWYPSRGFLCFSVYCLLWEKNVKKTVNVKKKLV